MIPEICCIGHITLDKIITPRLETYMPGGTAFYVAHALANLDHTGFRLLTSVGPTEMGACGGYTQARHRSRRHSQP